MIKTVKTVKYVDDDGFEFTFQPIEDSLTITETPEGYEAKYLTQDDDYESPEEWGDNNLFLVNYHRDFEVTRDDIITKDDVINWYRGDFSDYEDEDENIPDHIPQNDKYWIFSLSMLSHSGVRLYLGNMTPSCDPGG